MMSDKEISLIQSTWAEVYKKPFDNGSVIFKTFLDKYDYYQHFPKFNKAPRDKVTEDPAYKKNVLAIMEKINKIVASLNNSDQLKKELDGLAATHKIHGIAANQFEQLFEIIVGILDTAFKITPEAKEAWKKLFNKALPILMGGL